MTSNPPVPSPTLQQTTSWDLSFLSVLIPGNQLSISWWNTQLSSLFWSTSPAIPVLPHFEVLGSKTQEYFLPGTPSAYTYQEPRRFFYRQPTVYHSPKILREDRNQGTKHPTKTTPVINTYNYNFPNSRCLDTSGKTKSVTVKTKSSLKPRNPTIAGTEHSKTNEAQVKTLKGF